MRDVGITEEQARSLASGTYGRASLEHIASFGVPLFMVQRCTISTRNVYRTRDRLSNGTAFFVDLGQGPFVVTANHVVEAALAATVERVGLFPNRFERPALPPVQMPDLDDRIIIRDAERDIATFRVTSDEVEALRVSKLSVPPRVPTEGIGGVAFVGFPGVLRDFDAVQRGPDGPEITLSWTVYPGFGVAASVSDRQIIFQFDASELIGPPPGFRHPDLNLDIRGMSGGPMLMKCETQSGIEYWAPAAVITQGEMREDLNGGLLFASRLDSLGADGRI